MKKYLMLLSFLIGVFIFVEKAEAAAINVFLRRDVIAVGEKFAVDIKIDSEGSGINAAEAALVFPKNIIEIESVDKTNSVFNFWPTEPVFDNSAGAMSFVGGAANAYKGRALQILRIIFKAKKAGIAELKLNNTAVTAADADGTDVISAAKGASLKVVKTAEASMSLLVPLPTQITREPAKAGNLPFKPKISVPFFPDSQRWYDAVAPFLVQWTLSDDVSDVATAVTNNPSTEPDKSEGLFESKIFPALLDGEWYLHVRFKNKSGWGPTEHYRIAIDTTPPRAFDVALEGNSGGGSMPILVYKITDELSGIDTYYIKVDGEEAVETAEENFALSYLRQGAHTIVVGAMDRAGNSTEKTIDVNITKPAALLSAIEGRPLLTIFGFQISKFIFFLGLTVLVLAAVVAVWYLRRLFKMKS